MLQEINNHDWADFCRRISRERHGASVHVETIPADRSQANQAGDLTLDSMDLDTSNPCNDVIHLRPEKKGEAEYNIVEPIHILLQGPRTGHDFNRVQIQAETGTVFLTFHPTIHAEMLEGLRVG